MPSSTFGYIPKSDQVAHLTVTKSVKEKYDAPDTLELKGTMSLDEYVGGKTLIFYLSTGTIDPTVVTLPLAVPGLAFSVIISQKLTVDDSATPNTVSSDKLTLNCLGNNTMWGIVLDTSTQPSDNAPVEGKTTIELPVGGSAGEPFAKIMPSFVEFSCVEYGVWRVKAYGLWVIPSS